MHKLGRPRLDGRLKAAQRLDVGLILVGRLFGDAPDRLVERQVGEVAQGARVDLVVEVGEVAHIGDGILAIDMAQQPEQHVEDNRRAGVADMGEVVDRRAADIHPHVLRIYGHEVLLRARQRVGKAQALECPGRRRCFSHKELPVCMTPKISDFRKGSCTQFQFHGVLARRNGRAAPWPAGPGV